MANPHLSCVDRSGYELAISCLGLPCAGIAGVLCTNKHGSVCLLIRNLIQTCTGPLVKGSAPTYHDQNISVLGLYLILVSLIQNIHTTVLLVFYEQWNRHVTKVYFVITDVCKLLLHLRRK